MLIVAVKLQLLLVVAVAMITAAVVAYSLLILLEVGVIIRTFFTF